MRFFCLFYLVSLSAFGSKITVNELIAGAQKNFPKIKQIQLKIEKAKAKQQKNKGAFDTYLAGKGKKFLEGYYDSNLSRVSVIKPLQTANSEIEIGHKRGFGINPTYYSEYDTDSSGEFFLSFSMSLWRYREIDPRRFDLWMSQNETQIEKLNWALEMMDLKSKVNKVFWKWVVYDQKFKVYESLVQLNTKRLAAVKKRVNKKDLASIYVVESEQYLLNFKAELAEIEAELKNIIINLSFYNTDLSPDISPAYSLPKSRLVSSILSSSTMEAIDKRPELRVLNLLIDNSKLEILNAQQKLAPKIDLNAQRYEAKDEKSPYLDETLVGISIEIPIERNLGNGDIAQARANQKIVQAQQELVKREIRFRIDGLKNKIQGDINAIDLILKEVDNAKKLQIAEWKKFKSGASDFFLLNTRDVNLAKAQIKLIEKYADYKISHFDLEQWISPIEFQ